MEKTAMEELIDYVIGYMEVLGMPAMMIKDKATNLLPKEREQIEEAYRNGKYHESNGTIDEINMKASDYFTQKYGHGKD